MSIMTSAVPRAPAVQIILHTYSSIGEILARFDVDCCCIAYDFAKGKLLMSARCRRALAHAVNVMDSKHHSKVYCRRLEKYAYRHGLCVGVPGFRPELVTENLLMEKYVYVKERDLLCKIDQYGMPRVNRTSACLLDKKCTMQYSMAHRVSTVDGFKRLVVWDAYSRGTLSVRHAQAPQIHSPDADDGRPRTEASPNTVVVKSACAPDTYYLLWGANLPESDGEAEVADQHGRDGICDIDGYCCTPLEKAYVLFDRLLDEHLLNENQADGGAVTRLLGRTIQRQNGHVSCHTAARHLDPSWRATDALSFVFDFVPCESTEFGDLRFLHDASRTPLQQDLDDEIFEMAYGLSRRLRFWRHRPREPLQQDLLSTVY